ncbi:hypothetical protein [Arundinibacter roseus]|uniref:DUF1990 family protein n=1 Tax=Arundinibacter roseus TaxID=2070510 RepID=A0A4R4KJY6_9BACT|nr:hypothetical protein [Arundinibacter roseus]TDB66861.1 hypothetical protein EZE20_06975 [Arundinibacter roseus]
MPISETSIIQSERIPQKTVQEYLADKKLHACADFDKLKSTSYQPAEQSTYHVHSKTFLVKAKLSTVWNTYLSISPRETWRSEIVSFGCMYCKNSQELTYMEDEYDGLREGQVLFLNISLLWGLVNIAVAHQIIRVDSVKKEIEFSYIEGGKTEGSQVLSFSAIDSVTTKIVHKTTYKGTEKSYIREQVLYPFLHAKVIAAFHDNVKQKVLEDLQ